ncbi:MAG: ATP-dependent DNA helicase RecG, partial [Anaerovoracaceae bacterium]
KFINKLEPSTDANKFIRGLPFELTKDQKNAVEDIITGLNGREKIHRLVQGDVGSGKTVIAAAAMYAVSQKASQSAFMAPTEILAKQHYETLIELFQGFNINVGILLGSQKSAQRKSVLEFLENGDLDVVVGTHALFSKNVLYKNLDLVIVDEQHRFGVSQRKLLSQKGVAPHVIVMSATPIPRSLGLIVYGDMRISRILEKPPGRKEVKTYIISENKRKDGYRFIEKQLEQGYQAYIVCPAVKNTVNTSLMSLESVYKMAKTIFNKYRIGVIFSKAKQDDKDRILEEFKNGEIDVLLSTTMIEVGVHIPRSNIMLVESANRFGLAQLHQLRGRIGRGSSQSYCILVNDSDDKKSRERLDILRKNSDGFKIAEADMEIRGVGQLFGTRQHGELKLKFADLERDLSIFLDIRKIID